MDVVTLYFGHQRRGCWRRLSDLLRQFAEDGRSVLLFLTVKPAEPLHGIETHVVSVPDAGAAGLASFYWGVWQHLWRRRGDLDHCLMLGFDLANAAGLVPWKKRFSAKLILAVRGALSMDEIIAASGPVGRQALELVSQIAYRCADQIIYVSRETERAIMQRYGAPQCPTVVLPNNATQYGWPRTPPDVEAGTWRVGYLGQFVPRKNVSYLIDAFASVFSFNAKLVIQGDGPLRASLQNYAADRMPAGMVEWRPWSENVAAFYADVDIVVLPSLFDDAATVLLDGLASGKIVFASHRGGNAEILDYDSELLFPLEDGPEALAFRLTRVMTEPAYRAALVARLDILRRCYNFNWSRRMRDILLPLE